MVIETVMEALNMTEDGKIADKICKEYNLNEQSNFLQIGWKKVFC